MSAFPSPFTSAKVLMCDVLFHPLINPLFQIVILHPYIFSIISKSPVESAVLFLGKVDPSTLVIVGRLFFEKAYDPYNIIELKSKAPI